ncbi:hypothetical protein EMIHUDRAFT_469573 [Emiliania huxleyi CCMP1516]|uniref:peptidylprolyl isomerase n=2 Tax=Emiliania huxleyi TaxID=2903 RepID=A0A0D3JID7_EMIH1|nr:hypothetical protein EMIHUDRAFT_469573 [Emiliania huxleyi CCMP1516]EOD23272.1 hypothetical protein EMIHUDRAFT_469573 [Emiliania huxleyi CCMP1516]|eukprot:XP_005775701.1 hypothetical protein EMIHUDRAFT_469573 [Emiliania huxleyi CCMP1516]
MASPALDLDALQRAVDGLRTQQESVQRERAELQSMKATVEENLAQFKQRVKLNVGGSKFETTLTTLTRYPESMLGAMFSGRHEVPPDDEGYVFIDRDGKQFGTILNFLRTGTLDVPSSTKAATELKREMEYYQLPFDGCSNHEDTDTPIVETVLTQAAATNYHLQPLDMRAHTAKVQEKLQANPRLRIVANNVSKDAPPSLHTEELLRLVRPNFASKPLEFGAFRAFSRAELKPLPKSATILQRVVHALRARGGASSAPAIVKAVAEGGYTDGAKVRKAIKAGVTAGALQTSAESAAKFWVGGEPIPEAAAGPAVATEELSPGDAGGSPVAKGDAVAIDYTLSLLATGEKVEAGKKFCFTVGGGDVIKDMRRVGLDTVPWQLGYGKRGSGPGVPPCSDLVFRIKLVRHEVG